MIITLLYNYFIIIDYEVDDAVTLLLESLPSNSILRVEKGSQHKESK
jgi:hypothetical protein